MLRINLEKSIINPRIVPWIIWSIAGLFYFYEITLRMLPSTMSGYMMSNFHINGTSFGIFTSLYYWAYTPMQVPAGLIVDRFRIRNVIMTACAFCVLGFLISHTSTRIHIAEIGRFIIGFGSAFAYVSILKVASIWLPHNRFGLASCILDSLGGLGAVFLETTIIPLNLDEGYHITEVMLFIAGLLTICLMYIFLKNAPSHKTKKGKTVEYDTRDKTDVWEKLARITKNPQMWLIGVVGCLFYLPSSVLGDVWGLSYLRGTYHFSQIQASHVMTAFFLGWVIMGPILGAISDKVKRRCLPMMITIAAAAILFAVVIYTPGLSGHLFSADTMYVLFFLIGSSVGTHPLVFALAKENFNDRIAGTVVAFSNMLVMVGGIIFQPVFGHLLDLSHHSTGLMAVQHYTPHDYTFAMSILPLALVASLVIMFFVKDTGHKLDSKRGLDTILEETGPQDE